MPTHMLSLIPYLTRASGEVRYHCSLSPPLPLQVVMYDEPTAGLDPVASTVVEDLMRDLHNGSKQVGLWQAASRQGLLGCTQPEP